MNVLDLFSGIGGFSLGLERAGFKTIAFCEIDSFCRKVLKKHWPDVVCYEDIRELNGDEIKADVITGGYPCQPFSHAGNRAGEADDRHLWPEMYRIIKVVRPRWVIAENVAGHISMGLDTVLSDLESEGYTCWTFVIPACAVDARHRRDRVWIIANSEFKRAGIRTQNEGGAARIISDQNRKHSEEEQRLNDIECRSVRDSNVADTNAERQPQQEGGEQDKRGRVINSSKKTFTNSPGNCRNGIREARKERQRLSFGRCNSEPNSWPTEPNVGRVAHGVSGRVDRLKGLGNAVVPQIPELIGRAIMEAEK
ncbi:MAG: DNA cytosine methyltransferase [Candidatus Scalindua sp.]